MEVIIHGNKVVVWRMVFEFTKFPLQNKVRAHEKKPTNLS